jgi:hypothetical protein
VTQRLRIGELLVEAGVLSTHALRHALELQKKDGRRLGTILVENKFVSEPQLIQALSRQLSVPWVSVSRADPPDEVLQLVPPVVAATYGLVPVYKRQVQEEGESLYVAMDDPTNDEALRAVAAACGMPVRPMVAAPSEIAAAILEFYDCEEATGQLPRPGAGREVEESSERRSAPTLVDVPKRPARGDGTPASAASSRQPVARAEAEASGGPSTADFQPGSRRSAGAVFSPGILEAPRAVAPPPIPDSEKTQEIPKTQEMPEYFEEDTEQHVTLGEQERREAEAAAAARAAAENADTDSGSSPLEAATPQEQVGAQAPAEPEEPGTKAEPTGRRRRRSVSLTLLDGTRIDLGSGTSSRGGTAETVAELVQLLRLSGKGEPVPKPLPHAHWELFLADLIELLVERGVLSEEDVMSRYKG